MREEILDEKVEAGLFGSNSRLRSLGTLVARVRSQHSRVNRREHELLKKGVMHLLRNSPSPVLRTTF